MLALDVGNTHLRLALFRDGEIIARDRLRTNALGEGEPAAGELARLLSRLASGAGGREAWIASVVPAAEPALEKILAQAGFAARFIRSGQDRILPHALASPESTGVDRLLAALAAGARHFAGPAEREGYAVVQCGSAATVDIVDRDGVFRGGHILPGPEMWLSGLARAARIPDYAGERPDWENRSLGNNTRDAARRGLAAGLPEAVAASLRLLMAEAGIGRGEGPPPAALTGGWGGAVARLVPGCRLDQDLLLHGVRIFALKTRPNA
ncbi:MAG: type III pantothenate kinase [Planctomycetota bacterium]|jgi:type III pantothenate kinase|nr:type III pantothenate kinase [Planctomycetota bacterium]